MANPVKIVFIGAGNLSTCLATALNECGIQVLQIFSRTKESADALASKIGCDATSSYDNVVRDADIYIISVSDSAIVKVIENVSLWNSDALFCHTAGSVSMDVFSGSGIRRYGVLYPMQTFSKCKKVDFKKVPFFVEASGRSELEMLKGVAYALSSKVYEADSEARKSLHISAVFACNFVNHMFAISSSLLARHGISFDVMLPLIEETVEKIHSVSPDKAQTGPAVRNDVNVMNSHIRMLEGDSELQDIYRLISLNIRKWAQ